MAQNGKLYLAEALIRMMKDQSIEEIKISELVKKAGVSRMTYYRYFEDKDEILEYYMNYIFNLFIDWEKRNGQASFGTQEHIKNSLEFFRQYGDFARCIYQSGNDGIMLRMVNNYMETLPDFKKKSAARRFAIYYYAGAVYNCYIQWVLEDFATPVDKMTKIMRGSWGNY